MSDVLLQSMLKQLKLQNALLEHLLVQQFVQYFSSKSTDVEAVACATDEYEAMIAKLKEAI